MGIKDVTALRKEGRLQEAYQLAERELREDENKWTQMSMFWVLRDICLSHISSGQIDNANVCLDRMSRLLPTMMDDSEAGKKSYEKLLKQLKPGYSIIKSASELSKVDPIHAYTSIISQFGENVQSLDDSLHEDFGWILYRYLKARVAELTSLEVRKLLWNYINLKNERPSMLHSSILSFALNFAKDHSDFVFQNFLKLWGMDNFRLEDKHDESVNGKTFPSLISRICRFYVEHDVQLDINSLQKSSRLQLAQIIDFVRQPYFWKILTLNKEGNNDQIWVELEQYNEWYASYGPSHWHSEILRLATRCSSTARDERMYINFVMNWNIQNFSAEDWEPERDVKGNEYTPLSIRVVKNCFEILKKTLHFGVNVSVIQWLIQFYDLVLSKINDDEWVARQRTQLSVWIGNTDDAIQRYRNLLVSLGDKYYVWHELARCIDDVNLKTGLLLKAKSLEKNEDFIGEIHLDLAESLLKLGYFKQAKSDLTKYIEHRKLRGRSLSPRYESLMNQSMEAIGSTGIINNVFNPKVLIAKAEDFVYQDYPWRNFVFIGSFNIENKDMFRFVDDKNLSFSINIKRFPTLKKLSIGTIVKFRGHFEEKEVPKHNQPWRTDKKTFATPLMAEIDDSKPWSLLQEGFGYVEYVNSDKNILHVVTSDCAEVYYSMSKNQQFAKGDFIKFKHYKRFRKNPSTDKEEEIMEIVDVHNAGSEEAIIHFKSRIVVVDDINVGKELFHIVLGSNFIK